MACLHCHECVNAHWYYPRQIHEPGKGVIDNPYAGRCKNCGSREFTVGAISKAMAEFWEKSGWEFVPWKHAMNVPDPHVKNNIYIIGSGCHA